ncbi:MAG: GNAT family protein [Micrococcaceae bacterium]|nr:GNAT family protein [Micrococcaceae bacterium]
MPDPEVSLQPVLAGHEKSIERFLSEPESLGLDWSGFGNLARHRSRLLKDGYIGARGGLLAVVSDERCVGEVSWQAAHYGGPAHAWRIGVGVLPEARGRGIARAAQLLLCAYLFEHTTAERIEAVVRTDNTSEQHALESIGFTRDGTLPRAQFKLGSWHDLALYSMVRADRP